MRGFQFEKIGREVQGLVTQTLETLGLQKAPSNDKEVTDSPSTIHQLAAQGDLHQLRLLLSDSSINFDTPDQEGNTPLFFAMASADIETVEFFLDRQCRLNFENTHGQSPIFEAVHTNNMQFLEYVLSLENIDASITDENNNTIMHIAAINGLINSCICIATHKPELINHHDKYGKTPLMYAAENGYLNIVKLFLSDNTQVNSVCHDGWSALMYATSKEALDVMAVLIAYGANLECTDHAFKQTAFLIACKQSHVQAAELLLNHKADFNVKDYYKRTALHLAVETHNEQMVKLVLSTRVEVSALDKFGLTAREWAVVNSSPEILKRILRAEKIRK